MPRLTLRIDFDAEHRLGKGKVRLLELIEVHGSISAAGRAMGMSYRRAWILIESLNATFTEPVVTTRVGGSGGGSATVTAFGRRVVDAFRTMEATAASSLSPEIDFLRQALTPALQASAAQENGSGTTAPGHEQTS